MVKWMVLAANTKQGSFLMLLVLFVLPAVTKLYIFLVMNCLQFYGVAAHK